jgi:uncharacterized coiled-coil protein SlyX
LIFKGFVIDAQHRIEKLEVALAHQQRLIEQLNEVVTEQTKEMLRMGRTLDQLTKQVVELRKRPTSTEPQPTLEDEKPPHY